MAIRPLPPRDSDTKAPALFESGLPDSAYPGDIHPVLAPLVPGTETVPYESVRSVEFGNRAHVVVAIIDTENPDEIISVSLGELNDENLYRVLDKLRQTIEQENKSEESCLELQILDVPGDCDLAVSVKKGDLVSTMMEAAGILRVSHAAVSLARKRANKAYDAGKAGDRSFIVRGVRMIAIDDVKD